MDEAEADRHLGRPELLLLVSQLEMRLRAAYAAAGKTDAEMEAEHPVLADARAVLDKHWRR